MKKIRWGIISTANIAQTQVIPVMFRADNAVVAAIASRNGKVHTVAESLGISKAYESYEALLDDPEIDAVYIPLPNHLHREWTINAARKGKHVLCEKPAALNAEEAAEMVCICEEEQVLFMEAFMYQLHPQHNRVKEIIASGEIGELKLMKSSHAFHLGNRSTDIRATKEWGGGSLYDVGCYCIHAIRHITESEPVAVQASAQLDPVSGIDLTALVQLELANGVRAMFDCSFDTVPRNEYEIVGTLGTIKVPYAFRPDLQGGIGSIIVSANGETREEQVAGDLYRLEIEHFSAAILDGAPLAVSSQSTIDNMRVIEACLRAIESGKRESVE